MNETRDSVIKFLVGTAIIGGFVMLMMQPVPDNGEVGGASTGGTYSENYGTSECTIDCSGHDAGYEWAQDNDITDTEYSEGNSESFNEGVRAYAEENQ